MFGGGEGRDRLRKKGFGPLAKKADQKKMNTRLFPADGKKEYIAKIRGGGAFPHFSRITLRQDEKGGVCVRPRAGAC